MFGLIESECLLANYKQRRDSLLAQLDENSVVIIVGNTAKTRSKNINYHFRPDNDLYYLTGFVEQNAVAVLRPNHQSEFVLFTRINNDSAEVSFGARAGINGAMQKYHADQAFDIESLDKVMPELLQSREKVYLLDEQGIYQHQYLAWLNHQRLNSGFDVIKKYRQLLPLQPLLHNQRVIKSSNELALMKQAIKASADGHKQMMKSCKVGMNECQLAAIFNRTIADYGCKYVAYPSIVASGNNGCCLHYEENNSELINGELILIDAGAEYQQYCADITRTWPVNGKFSVEQKQIYQIVLQAIDTAIAKIKPGLVWNDIYQTCMEVMAQGLLDLGLLSGTLEQIMAEESYREFTVHKTGHWLGMDVHDVGAYHEQNGDWLKLRENMIFTIEPGIYINENNTRVDKKWRGIAIRIEDDILVTSSGHENLSKEIPRTVKDIEMLMAQGENS